MAQLGEKVSVSTPFLTTANRFWALNIRPYNKNLKTHAGLNSHSSMELEFVVNVSHREHAHDKWVLDVVNRKHSAKVVCPTHVKDGSQKPCDLLSLVFEEYVDADYHLVEASITSKPGSKDEDPAVGDVELIMNYGTKKYMDFEIGTTIFYLLTSLAAFVLFIVSVRKYNFRTWSYQQMWTFAILIAAILYNSLCPQALPTMSHTRSRLLAGGAAAKQTHSLCSSTWLPGGSSRSWTRCSRSFSWRSC